MREQRIKQASKQASKKIFEQTFKQAKQTNKQINKQTNELVKNNVHTMHIIFHGLIHLYTIFDYFWVLFPFSLHDKDVS